MAKKKRKPWQNYLLTSGSMYLFTLIFSVAALVFIADKIPDWVQILMGILFMTPILAMFYLSGKREGEDMYKELSKGAMTQIHDKAPLKVPAYRCIFHTLGYAIPLTLLTIIAACAKVAFLRGILSVILMPVSLIYLGAGVLNFDVITLNLLYIYLPAILLGCLVYCGGYLQSVLLLKRRQGEIESELRSFDN